MLTTQPKVIKLLNEIAQEINEDYPNLNLSADDIEDIVHSPWEYAKSLIKKVNVFNEDTFFILRIPIIGSIRVSNHRVKKKLARHGTSKAGAHTDVTD
jgi:hypothetical protein